MKAKFKKSQLSAVDKKTVELVHPVAGNTGIEVTIAGPTHKAWKEALEVFSSKPEDDLDRGNHLFAAAVLGWDEEAMEAAYSPEAVLAMFHDPNEEWFAANIVVAVNDHKSFFPGLS